MNRNNITHNFKKKCFISDFEIKFFYCLNRYAFFFNQITIIENYMLILKIRNNRAAGNIILRKIHNLIKFTLFLSW